MQWNSEKEKYVSRDDWKGETLIIKMIRRNYENNFLMFLHTFEFSSIFEKKHSVFPTFCYTMQSHFREKRAQSGDLFHALKWDQNTICFYISSDYRQFFILVGAVTLFHVLYPFHRVPVMYIHSFQIFSNWTRYNEEGFSNRESEAKRHSRFILKQTRSLASQPRGWNNNKRREARNKLSRPLKNSRRS